MAVQPIDGEALWDKLEDALWYDNYDRDMAEKIVLDMPTLTPQNEWIAVDERLPTKSGEYFVYTTEENISTAEFDEDCGEFGFWQEYYQDGAYLGSEWIKADWFTHWMYLPAPPDRRPPEGNCKILDYAEACDECGFCGNTPTSPPDGGV